VATTLQVDASSPADVDLTGQGASVSTGAFSPPAKSLAVMFVGQGKTNSANSSSITLSDTSGAVWKPLPFALGSSASGGGVTGWWTFFDQAPGSITVTASFSGWSGTGGGRFINPLVFIGAHWDQSGAGMNSRVSAAGSTDATVSLNAVAKGSWVWGICDAPNINTTFTAAASNILDTTYSGGATDGVTMIIFRLSGLTASPGTFTLGGTWGSATAFTNIIAFEVLPSQMKGQKLALWHPGKGPGRSRFYQPPRTVQTDVVQSIWPSAIGTAEAFGTPQVSLNINPSGIATAEAFGTATVSQNIVATGIASAEAFGAAQLKLNIIASGIASGEAWGTPTVSLGPLTISPTGIASAEAFGNPAVSLNVTAQGIPSGEAFGTPSVSLTIAPSGIDSGEAFGVPTVTPDPVTISPVGIASAEAFGVPTVAKEPRWLLVAPVFDERMVHEGVRIPRRTALTVFGDDGGLVARETPSTAELDGKKYVFFGGYEYIIKDPAVKDLWVASGFEVQDV
jgi:hypothetical protein